MRLLQLTKDLRYDFPDIKIRQLRDAYNRVCNLFVLPECEHQLTLTVEHDYLLLNFYNMTTYYNISDSDYKYMIKELYDIINCNACVLSVNDNEQYCGCFLMYNYELNDIESLEKAIIKVYFDKTGKRLLRSGIIELSYTNSNLDKILTINYNKLIL